MADERMILPSRSRDDFAVEVRDQETDSLNATPMERLRFGDFLALKAGRDEFSRLKLDALRARVSAEQREAAEAAFPDDAKLLAQALRWMLRGLHTAKAIRKVKTDAEISQQAAGSKYRKRR